MRGGTKLSAVWYCLRPISIHPPRAGRDHKLHPLQHRSCYFNPPSPCGEGRKRHGLLQEADISIHPPRAGRDAVEDDKAIYDYRFQSTLPVRGGTPVVCVLTPAVLAISIHPPRAGRDLISSPFTRPTIFQSTLPVRGGTGPAGISFCIKGYFNPPSPCGEGHTGILRTCRAGRISIHPPRAGRDKSHSCRCPTCRDFNPPSPCGEGRLLSTKRAGGLQFQSTLPVRGGTTEPPEGTMTEPISIHPPRAGRDEHIRLSIVVEKQFQSTLPVRGGTEYEISFDGSV